MADATGIVGAAIGSLGASDAAHALETESMSG